MTVATTFLALAVMFLASAVIVGAQTSIQPLSDGSLTDTDTDSEPPRTTPIATRWRTSKLRRATPAPMSKFLVVSLEHTWRPYGARRTIPKGTWAKT